MNPFNPQSLSRSQSLQEDPQSHQFSSYQTLTKLNQFGIGGGSRSSSPTFLSGHRSNASSISLAEKRQTSVSKYLITQDFKSDFANKLNHLRQREQTQRLSPPPIHQSPKNHSRFLLPVQEHDDDHHQPSIKHTQVDLPPPRPRSSCRSSSLNQDPDELSARHEVITKLADQLAEQIEENDQLIFELGVVRSNYARLQAIRADQEDELACLTERNRQLESIIATRKLSPSRSFTTTPTTTTATKSAHINTTATTTACHHDPVICSRTYAQSLQSIRSLTIQIVQARRALCRLQYERYQSSHSFKLYPYHSDHLKSGSFEPTSIHNRPRSWSGPLVPSRLQQFNQLNPFNNNKPAFSFSPRPPLELAQEEVSPGLNGIEDQTDLESLKDQINRLKTELTDCQEARAATEVSLQALVASINDDQDLNRAWLREQYALESAKSTDHQSRASKGQGLGLFQSELAVDEEQQPGQRQHNESNPLRAISGFGTDGWITTILQASPVISPSSPPLEQPKEVSSGMTPLRKFNFGAFFSNPSSTPSSQRSELDCSSASSSPLKSFVVVTPSTSASSLSPDGSANRSQNVPVIRRLPFFNRLQGGQESQQVEGIQEEDEEETELDFDLMIDNKLRRGGRLDFKSSNMIVLPEPESGRSADYLK